jgi:hypothetical protein
MFDFFFFLFYFRNVYVDNVKKTLYNKQTNNERGNLRSSESDSEFIKYENDLIKKIIINNKNKNVMSNTDFESYIRNNLRKLANDFLNEYIENDRRMSKRHMKNVCVFIHFFFFQSCIFLFIVNCNFLFMVIIFLFMQEILKLQQDYDFLSEDTNLLLDYVRYSVENEVVGGYFLSNVTSWDYTYYDVITNSYDIGVIYVCIYIRYLLTG